MSAFYAGTADDRQAGVEHSDTVRSSAPRVLQGGSPVGRPRLGPEGGAAGPGQDRDTGADGAAVHGEGSGLSQVQHGHA